MLDLNVDAVLSVDSTSCDDEADRRNMATAGSVTSTTTTNTNNAAADEADCNSSTGKCSVSLLNFSILNKNVIEIEDDVNNGVNTRDELQLFPTGASSLSPSMVRAKCWLNLSVPEVTGSTPVELGIYKAQSPVNNQVQQPQVKKSRRGPRSRSSQYRGVTFYRRTGRWESHIWDCGKQVYLGGFDTAHAAARAYDRAAVKFRGVDADINFTISDYEEDMKQMKSLSKEEFVLILRRHSTGFSRGSSKYRGVTLHKCGRWEARMGQFLGKKAYDKAAIKCNGREAVTNFEPSNYDDEMKISSRDGGSGGSLDLSLGISLSDDGPQGKRLKVEPTSGSQQLIMSTKAPPMWAGIYSGFAPNNKEIATRMCGVGVPFPGFSNWTWKMPSNSVVSPVPLLSSSLAASSGFSSTTSQCLNPLIPLTSRTKLPATAFHGLQ